MTVSAFAWAHNCGDPDCTDLNCEGRQHLNQLRKCLETIRHLQRISNSKQQPNQDERDYMLKQLEVSFQPSEEKSGIVDLGNVMDRRRKAHRESRQIKKQRRI